MRLADLDPKLTGGFLRFDCPCCVGTERATSVRIPVDEHGAWGGEGKWAIGGRFPDTTTISPSIDMSAAGHWHGWVTDGEVR